MAHDTRLFGVTVLPEYVQYEGSWAVLDRLQQAGVTAVATSPYVMAPADQASGVREPPQDAGAGAVRLLDRPLWGERALWVRTAPSFVVDRQLYRDLRYQPPPDDPLTVPQGQVVGDFLTAARSRGLRTVLQVQAAIPPGYRVQFGGPAGDDIPLLPDGRQPEGRVANQGSLASPHIQAYQAALIRDLCRHYPQVDAIRFDWPEYPPYRLDTAFVDFGAHAQRRAEQLGLDWEAMRNDCQALYQQLHGPLRDADVAGWDRNGWEELIRARPGVAQMLRFKARLSAELLSGFRRELDAAGGAAIDLEPTAFPHPWSLVSGMDLHLAADSCRAVSVKLYGMHWAMMLHFYGSQLLGANPQLSETALVSALVRALDIDDQALPRLDNYRYPPPDQPHPIGAASQRRKIRQAVESAGEMPVYALAHGYGPTDDVVRRAEIAWNSPAAGVWLNRYGYLNDEKLRRIGAIIGG